MTKRAKLFERLKNNPKDATFAQIEKLLGAEGFTMVRIAGSHHIFKKSGVTFVIPTHGNKVKEVYVRRVIQIIEESEK
jgi:predicted RNA binding protein YcfA (HicA-like mRNA interferase family)